MITLEEDETEPATITDDSLKPGFNMGKRIMTTRVPNRIRNDSVDMNLKRSFANEDQREASGSLNDSEADLKSSMIVSDVINANSAKFGTESIEV